VWGRGYHTPRANIRRRPDAGPERQRELFAEQVGSSSCFNEEAFSIRGRTIRSPTGFPPRLRPRELPLVAAPDPFRRRMLAADQ